ncbi:MAG: isoprenylcysteine carboxylmethyltransferase family protein [Verrucomicrobia subdivision 3 bacterium]|nr:isoprenylcysteine carboxylmethyltransferase family protein [Limisphaerales bacterium]
MNQVHSSGTRRKLILPRWFVLLLAVTGWPFLVVLFHGVLPWAISRMTRRFGWAEQHPGSWNWLGLIFVALGSIVVLWFWLVHVRKVSAREKVELKSTPDYLLIDGPYRYSRNPAYVALLTIWFGWTVFYGSLLVLVGFFLLLLLLNFVVIPREERGLEARHKETYRQYLQRVPRWF